MGCSLATHLSSIGSSNTSTGTGGKMARFGHHGDVVVDNVASRAKGNAKDAHVGLVEAPAFYETPCYPRELPARIFFSRLFKLLQPFRPNSGAAPKLGRVAGVGTFAAGSSEVNRMATNRWVS
jgi:hypothetical protein